jgi:hypothetical protein
LASGSSRFPVTWSMPQIAAATYVTVRYPGRIWCPKGGRRETTNRWCLSGVVADEGGVGLDPRTRKQESGLWVVADQHNFKYKRPCLVTSFPCRHT